MGPFVMRSMIRRNSKNQFTTSLGKVACLGLLKYSDDGVAETELMREKIFFGTLFIGEDTEKTGTE